MTVHRRTVLAALGAAAASAGCFGDGGSTTDTPAGTPTETDTPTETATATPDGRFSDVPCPSFTDTERTVCSHTDAGDAAVVLEPEAAAYRPVAGNDTVETLRLTLRNRGESNFGLNPHAWQIHRREGDDWQRVAPDEWIEPWYTVEPGETYDWILATERHPTPGGDDDTIHVMEPLEPGIHAFAVHGQLAPEGGDGGGSDATSVECVALFEVVDVTQDGESGETAANGDA
jgi:hypothetical protein